MELLLKNFKNQGNGKTTLYTIIEFNAATASFSLVVSSLPSSSSLSNKGTLQEIQTLNNSSNPKDIWYKVPYDDSCKYMKQTSADMVLARVQFLVDHPETLPDYNIFFANCECVAIWCKTGIWMTSQVKQINSRIVAGAFFVAVVLEPLPFKIAYAFAYGKHEIEKVKCKEITKRLNETFIVYLAKEKQI